MRTPEPILLHTTTSPMGARLPGRWMLALLLAGSSVLAIAVVVLVLRSTWYPGPLLQVTGDVRRIAMLALADMVIGCVLVVLVYKPGKRGLKGDLVLLAALRVAAFAYGCHAIHAARPAYVAILEQRATLVRANAIYGTPKPAPPYDKAPHGPLAFVVVEPPTGDAAGRLLQDVLTGGPDADFRPAYYRPASARPSLVLRGAIATGRGDGMSYKPLLADAGEARLLIDARGHVAGIVDAP